MTGSVRRRRASYVAGFLSIFLGSAVLTSFAALLDTALRPGIAHHDRTTLIIMSSAVGGWGAVVVGTAVATTLAVTTRQRVREFALLRSVGATPRQVVRMITGEVGVVGTAAVVLAAPVGAIGSVLLLHGLQDSHQISTATQHRFGWATFAIGAGAPLLAALLGSWITARRAASRRVTDGLFDAATGGRTVGPLRVRIGWILVAAGLACAITTVTTFHGADPNSSQSVASEGAIAAAIGFALLAPVLLAGVLHGVGPALGAFGVAGHLALLNLRERTQQAATPVMPITVLTGIASGTLSMQAVANKVTGAHRDKGTELLNYVIVGIITALAAAMLVNLLAATTADRRREFAQTRLIGATPAQVGRALRLETAVVTAIGLACGTVAASFTAIPFSLAQGTGLLPLAALEIHAAVVAGVILLSFATTVTSGRRAMSGNPIHALAAAS